MRRKAADPPAGGPLTTDAAAPALDSVARRERRVPRVFLLSPAYCGGQRAALLLNERAQFPLADRLQRPAGVPLGEVFAFLSGLYFRGKLAYARAFAQPPPGMVGSLVITPNRGLWPAELPVGVEELRAFGEVDIDARDQRYRAPLERDAGQLLERVGPRCDIVLLGSIASAKYVDVLVALMGNRLRFPAAFVGRGDMSRGGLLLRSARAGTELEYTPVATAERHGPRPARLPRLPR